MRYIIILMTALAISCSPRLKVEDIDVVEFYGMAKGLEMCHSITSLSEIQSQGRDTLISDRNFIQRFVKEINCLIPQRRPYSFDYRAAAILHKKDGSTVTLIFGESWGILYENKRMKDRPSLFQLIDEEIYDTQPGAHYWFPESERKMLIEMDSLILADPDLYNNLYLPSVKRFDSIKRVAPEAFKRRYRVH